MLPACLSHRKKNALLLKKIIYGTEHRQRISMQMNISNLEKSSSNERENLRQNLIISSLGNLLFYISFYVLIERISPFRFHFIRCWVFFPKIKINCHFVSNDALYDTPALLWVDSLINMNKLAKSNQKIYDARLGRMA